MQTTTKQAITAATISVQIPNGGEYITRSLKNGERVTVGSDATAELRLESPGVSGMHCVLSVENDFVNVKDCYSATGTFVDEARIQELEVRYSCVVRIGDNQIQLNLKNAQPRPHAVQPSSVPRTETPSPVATLDELASRLAQQSVVANEFIFADDPTETQEPSDSSSSVTKLLLDLQRAEAEIEILRERLDHRPPSPVTAEEDPFQQEMIELLREEILSLQEEIAKTHSRPALDQNFSEPLQPDDDLPSRDEVETVVARLETLLEELSLKDDQILGLQDLLLAADTANQAEQEEREHLASWLGEFEERFEAASHDWKLENDVLKRKLKDLEQLRDDTQAALIADSSSAKSEAMERVTTTMSAQITQQQEEIEALKKHREELKVSLQEAQSSTTREEEIRLSRERAEIARMKHDLEVKLNKHRVIEEAENSVDPEVQESEKKFREIRDELRESNRTHKRLHP